MNKEAVELIEFKKQFCENMIEVTTDYTAPIYKDMVKENRIYEFILSKLKSDENNYMNENYNLKQALNEIREYIHREEFFMLMNSGSIIDTPKDKPVGEDYFKAQGKIEKIIDKVLEDDKDEN